MAIMRKVYTTGLPVENDALPINATPVTATNCLTAQFFYDSDWQTPCRGVIINFTGGTGRGYIDDVTTERVVAAVSQGFAFINTITFPDQPMDVIRNNQAPIHNYYTYAREPQAYLNLLRDIITPDNAAFLTVNHKVVLCGTSRGAGLVAEWSELTRWQYANHKDRVIGLLLNAPAGSIDSGGWPGAYHQIRAIYGFYQKTNQPTLGLFGAGDVTNAPRQMVERCYRAWSNPLLKVGIVGDASYSHTWTYDHQAEWIGLAIAVFNTNYPG